MRGISRRRAGTVAAIGAVTVLALTACGGNDAGGTEEPELTLSDEPVTLSFTWWGNDTRHAITEELIATFEEEYPNITIEPQYTDWAGYWDKLSDGGMVTVPMEKQMWGDEFGMCVDRFGVGWMVNVTQQQS